MKEEREGGYRVRGERRIHLVMGNGRSLEKRVVQCGGVHEVEERDL